MKKTVLSGSLRKPENHMGWVL